MPDEEQEVTKLLPEDESRLMAQRRVVERYLAPESMANYATTSGKLGLIRAILQHAVFAPSQTYELQCLGIVLGDAFVQEMEMEWIMVKDSYGRDPAIRVPGTSVIVYPLTMISKRIENGENVDVFELFNGVADQVEKMKQEGY